MPGVKAITSQADERRPAAVRSASPRARGLLSQVSIIVPIGPADQSWRALLADLADVDEDAELLPIAADPQPADFDAQTDQAGPRCHLRWIATAAGRARQMNLGAQRSARPFLWFLHADSRVSHDALAALNRSLASHPHALHYFDLTFQNDGPRLAHLNALGVRFRSRCLGLPFGDQGLCLSRALFDRLGGFCESAPYGEDHLLVWAARRHRVPLRPVGAAIATSARRYQSEGWLRVTAQHLWRTGRQGLPQLLTLLRSRLP